MRARAGARRRAGPLAGAAVILLAFAYLVWGGIDENLVYFLTPSEVVARGTRAVGTPIRLGGEVEPGSIQWNSEALDLRFRVTDGTRAIHVHSRGAPPQMFRDGMGVVIEGRLSHAGVFESTTLMVKHSNEYRAPPHGEKPSEIYQDLRPRAGPP